MPELPSEEIRKLRLKIAKQLEAEPVSFKTSELDNLRSKFRKAGVNAQGIQKEGSHFKVLEEATRDVLFKTLDKLEGAKGQFGDISTFVKNNLNTIEFLDKTLRGHIVTSGKLTKLFSQMGGIAIGTGLGGPFGGLAGAVGGGKIADILANRALGNSLKKEALIGLSNGTPEAIRKIDELLKMIPKNKLLPKQGQKLLKEGVIELPAEAQRLVKEITTNKKEAIKPIKKSIKNKLVSDEKNIAQNTQKVKKFVEKKPKEVKPKTEKLVKKKEVVKEDKAKFVKKKIEEKETKQATKKLVEKLKPVEKKGDILKDLNPTGGIFVENKPKIRATAKLGKNITTLDKTSGKSADTTITIYRGVPNGKKEIVAGDFITTNKQLAKDYAGTGDVISKEVKMSDVLDDITEPLGEEYIYRPTTPKPKLPKKKPVKKTIETDIAKAKKDGVSFEEFVESQLEDNKSIFIGKKNKLNPNKKRIIIEESINEKKLSDVEDYFSGEGEIKARKKIKDIEKAFITKYSNGNIRVGDGLELFGLMKYPKEVKSLAKKELEIIRKISSQSKEFKGLDLLDFYPENSDLFKAYPDLKDLKIVIDNNQQDFVGGITNVFNEGIRMPQKSLTNKKKLYENIRHEVQHIIQGFENWEKGTTISKAGSFKQYQSHFGEIQARNELYKYNKFNDILFTKKDSKNATKKYWEDAMKTKSEIKKLWDKTK